MVLRGWLVPSRTQPRSTHGGVAALQWRKFILPLLEKIVLGEESKKEYNSNIVYRIKIY
jgi:hypothetical protein